MLTTKSLWMKIIRWGRWSIGINWLNITQKRKTLSELISNDCPLDDESKTFYQNFSAGRDSKLDKILTNDSFKTLEPVGTPPPIPAPRTQIEPLGLDNSLTEISKSTPETHTVQRPIVFHQDLLQLLLETRVSHQITWPRLSCHRSTSFLSTNTQNTRKSAGKLNQSGSVWLNDVIRSINTDTEKTLP